GSALYAPTFDKKLARMLSQDYAGPNFPTKHLAKDVDLFLAESEPLELDTRHLEGVRKTIQATLERGMAEADYSALFDALTVRPSA
ncbi:MAG: NAD(P)-dependent oxidoreductase, partial [Gammaproteobacteria bacterium]|nr:NAD(P)-dependent oxidoreductase [Gammaproteobacteria bacterium]